MTKEVASLLPCPFCGRSDEVRGPHWCEWHNRVSGYWWIECENCVVAMNEYAESATESGGSRVIIAKWNLRRQHPEPGGGK
jgi:hypothetical protein